MLSRALGLAGMTPADVQVIRLEVNEHREAFLRGEVDAVVTFDPVRQSLLEAGAVPIFDSSMIPGEIVDVLVVREELLHAHRDHIQHLIHAWQQSLMLIETRPEASARQMAQRLKLSAEDVLKSHANLEFPGWEQSRRLMDSPDRLLLKQAMKLADSMHEHRLIDAVPDLEGLIYSHYPAE
jgi:NitT/TauT family transport system substrate-binding protein